MAASAPPGAGNGGGAALGRPPDSPDRTAVPVRHIGGGREVAVFAVRHGAESRAFLDLRPHVFLPRTFRGPKVPSADGTRPRRSDHGAEFAVSGGDGLSVPGGACGLTPVPRRVEPDGTVLAAEAAPADNTTTEEGTR